MIIVYNGQNLTSTATEDEVCFMELDENGIARPLGRTTITFEFSSGTQVQMEQGRSVNTSAATTHTSSAHTKWLMTVSSQAQEGGYSNIRVVGAGVVAVSW